MAFGFLCAWCHNVRDHGFRGRGVAVLKLVSALGADRVFDPETIQILVNAIDEAWKTFQASSTPFASGRSAENARHILAKSIIEDATHGERDRHELSQSAILKLAQSNQRFDRLLPSKIRDWISHHMPCALLPSFDKDVWAMPTLIRSMMIVCVQAIPNMVRCRQEAHW